MERLEKAYNEDVTSEITLLDAVRELLDYYNSLSEKHLKEQWEGITNNIDSFEEKQIYHKSLIKKAEELYLKADCPFGSELTEEGYEYVRRNFFAKYPNGW